MHSIVGISNSILPPPSIFISNTCTSQALYRESKQLYCTPFIACLFVNDSQYIRFCRRFDFYIDQIPVFGDPSQTSTWASQQGHNGWYQHQHISIPYPVMYLGDIEIHWLHAHSKEEVLIAYNRRMHRMRTMMSESNRPRFSLIATEWMNDHSEDTHSKLIERFASIPGAIYIASPSDPIEDPCANPQIQIYVPWGNPDMIWTRDTSGIYSMNNQDTNASILLKYYSEE